MKLVWGQRCPKTWKGWGKKMKMDKWIRVGNEWFHDNGNKITVLDNNIVMLENKVKNTVSCTSFESFDKAEMFAVALTMTPKYYG